MSKGSTSSKLLLKKIIQQNSLPSKLDSHPSSHQHKPHLPQSSPLALNKKTQTFQEDLKLQSKVNYGLQIQSKVNHQLKIYSHIQLELKVHSRLNHDSSPKTTREIDCLQPKTTREIDCLQPKTTREIDCLQIQSRIMPILGAGQVHELPLQCLESRMLTQKLKVHSSIDGLEASKQSSQSQGQKYKQKSLPISDLIITDNKYMKRSNGLNQHDTFSVSEEEDLITAQVYENMKTLKHQILQQIQLVEEQLEHVEKDQLIEKINQEIYRVQSSLKAMKSNNYTEVQARTRPKTPEVRKLKSVKSQQSIKTYVQSSNRYIQSSNHEQQILQRRIMQQKQRSKRSKQKSIQTTQKLSKTKSHYKQLQLQLNFYENLNLNLYQNPNFQNLHLANQSTPILHHNQPNNQGILSPKIHKLNYKTKYYHFLHKEKTHYYQALQQHVYVIYRQMQTVKSFTEHKCHQLTQEISLLQNQIHYLDVKNVEKFFFASPKLSKTKPTHPPQPSHKPSAFHNHYSQKLTSTYSATSLQSPIPPLSPRSPVTLSQSPQLYSRSPQLYSQSPQLYSQSRHLYSRSPRLKSRSPHLHSPNIYERSPHYSGTSISSRSIRLTNKTSDKSTKQSQTKILRQKNQQDKIKFTSNLTNDRKGNKQKKETTRQNKENCWKKNTNIIKTKDDKKANQLLDQKKKVQRKPLIHVNNLGEMRTQPSDEYCINSQNQFKC